MLISYYVQGIIVGVLLVCFSFILIANNFQVRNLLGFVMGVMNQIILPFGFPTNCEINKHRSHLRIKCLNNGRIRPVAEMTILLLSVDVTHTQGWTHIQHTCPCVSYYPIVSWLEICPLMFSSMMPPWGWGISTLSAAPC